MSFHESIWTSSISNTSTLSNFVIRVDNLFFLIQSIISSINLVHGK
ncbi:MAG: hypothetical protein WCG25_04295 [bacterium]